MKEWNNPEMWELSTKLTEDNSFLDSLQCKPKPSGCKK